MQVEALAVCFHLLAILVGSDSKATSIDICKLLRRQVVLVSAAFWHVFDVLDLALHILEIIDHVQVFQRGFSLLQKATPIAILHLQGDFKRYLNIFSFNYVLIEL